MSKVILLTGATDGIGLLTATKLVQAGHMLIIHGRNQAKIDVALEQLNALAGEKVEAVKADLSDLSQLPNLIEQIKALTNTIDVIINNAGIFKTNNPITSAGLDVRFVVNTIAPYLITQSLLPLLPESGHVVNLSSAAIAKVDYQALTGEKVFTSEFEAYAQSKLGIAMWSKYLASVNPQTIIAVNPASMLASKMVKVGFGVAGKDLNIGADIIIKLATDPCYAKDSGKYFDNDVGVFNSPHPDFDDLTRCQKLAQFIDENWGG